MTVSRDLSTVLREHAHHDGRTVLHEFWCPGCGVTHWVTVSRAPHLGEGPVWAWNNDPERPSYSPEMLFGGETKLLRCRFLIRYGRFDYFQDCHHTLAGVTNLPMCPLPEPLT